MLSIVMKNGAWKVTFIWTVELLLIQLFYQVSYALIVDNHFRPSQEKNVTILFQKCSLNDRPCN